MEVEYQHLDQSFHFYNSANNAFNLFNKCSCTSNEAACQRSLMFRSMHNSQCSLVCGQIVGLSEVPFTKDY